VDYEKRKDWNLILNKVRSQSLQLEAVLRGCKVVCIFETGAVLICKHGFHREQLEKNQPILKDVIGEVEVYPTWDTFIDSDPLVAVAVRELGGRVIV
jgi:hypothetical protein